MEINLVLMAYRSAIKTSTNFTPYFMLYGRDMRLPFDIMYRTPEHELSREEYATNVRNTLKQAYERARNQLKLAHQRQMKYYDRRTKGTRYQQGDLVWLWSFVPEKEVAHKFQEPLTRPFKIEKQISDVTYEISDAVITTKKIVHFDRLNKATDGVRQNSPITAQVTSSKSDSDDTDLTYTIKTNAKDR